VSIGGAYRCEFDHLFRIERPEEVYDTTQSESHYRIISWFHDIILYLANVNSNGLL
jgi:hypothetical protein